jgi:uncharacterized protein YndB with AHSA1/START domain
MGGHTTVIASVAIARRRQLFWRARNTISLIALWVHDVFYSLASQKVIKREGVRKRRFSP